MRRFHGSRRGAAAGLAVLAGLLWSWLDTRTLLGPESLVMTRWRLAAFAVMAGAAFLAWARGDG